MINYRTEGAARDLQQLFRPNNCTFGVVLLLTTFCGGCPPPDVGLGDGSVSLDVATDMGGDATNPGVPSGPCEDDEVLDIEFDKSLSLDCVAVRQAIDARRSSLDLLRVEQTRLFMRSEGQRCCISRAQLMDMMRAGPFREMPLTSTDRHNYDRILGGVLCDRLTREIYSRHWAARHRECLPPDPATGGGGDQTGGGQ